MKWILKVGDWEWKPFQEKKKNITLESIAVQPNIEENNHNSIIIVDVIPDGAHSCAQMVCTDPFANDVTIILVIEDGIYMKTVIDFSTHRSYLQHMDVTQSGRIKVCNPLILFYCEDRYDFDFKLCQSFYRPAYKQKTSAIQFYVIMCFQIQTNALHSLICVTWFDIKNIFKIEISISI